MTEDRPPDLLYGHLGEPKYDPRSRQWHFPRQPSKGAQIAPLGCTVSVLEASKENEADYRTPAVERSRNIKHLEIAYPEVVPSSNLLHELGQTSEVVETITSNHDPLTSELLAFGRAENPTDARKVVQIAATAAGAAGELVRLVVLNKEQLGWDGNKSSGLLTLTANGGEQGWWGGNGTPIRQLVFFEAEGESSNWLAVRQDEGISILRPRFRTELVYPDVDTSKSYLLPSSRLDAHHILTFKNKQNGQGSFADVAFNFWDPQQLATIDVEGQWSIWGIAGQRKGKGLWKADRRFHGMVKGDGQDQDVTDSTLTIDGWGRSVWAGDPNTILFATRRSLEIFDTKSEPRGLLVPDLALVRSNDLLLDIKRSTSNASHVFVLTSSRIFWLKVIPTSESPQLNRLVEGAQILLSWVHFRDPTDTSLQLSLCEDNKVFRLDNQTSLVLLYSRVTDLITVFTFELNLAGEQASSVSDPYILQLPKHNDSSPRNHKSTIDSRLSSIVLRSLEYGSLYGHPLSETTQEYIDNNIIFYQLNVLHNDLAILESLHTRSALSTDIEVQAPDVRTHRRLLKSSTRISDADFVVPDWIDTGESRPVDFGPDSIEVLHSCAQQLTTLEQEDPQTLNFEWLLEEAQKHAVKPTDNNGDHPAPTTPFSEFLELVEASIEEKVSSRKPGIESLLELDDSDVLVTDLEASASSMIRFLDLTNTLPHEAIDQDEAESQPLSNVTALLTPAVSAQIGLGDSLEIQQIYEKLVQSFINPLPLTIPARARIVVEEIIQDISAQLCLASYGVRLTTQPIDDDDNQPETTFSLPMRRKASLSRLSQKSPSTSSRPSSQPPTSSPPPEQSSQLTLSTPSSPFLHPTSSPASTPGSTTSFPETFDQSSLRLSAPHFPLPTPTTLRRHIRHPLTLTPHGDPYSYDWAAVTQQLSTDSLDYPEMKSRKRKGRHKERKRLREQTLDPSSEPLPKKEKGAEVAGGSQPLASRDIVSQSQFSARSEDFGGVGGESARAWVLWRVEREGRFGEAGWEVGGEGEEAAGV